MSFQYWICINCRTTSWKNDSDKMKNREIIEISAVLLNTENGETEDQFHSYVKPVINPELSKYCIDTTGITQEMVDDEEEFLDVYKDFNSWLGHIKSGRNLNFATPLHRNAAKDGPNIMFCSWNSSTLNEHFKKELQRAKTAIPPILMTWTDVIKLYRIVYTGAGRETQFEVALIQAKIVEKGNRPSSAKPRSGISEAIHMAELAMILIKDGVPYNTTTDCLKDK